MSQASYESDDDPLLLVPSDRPLKRRRIESSPDEEIVESSDAEEREEIAATSPSYWRRLDVKHAQSLRQSGVEDVVMNDVTGRVPEPHPQHASEHSATPPSNSRSGFESRASRKQNAMDVFTGRNGDSERRLRAQQHSPPMTPSRGPFQSPTVNRIASPSVPSRTPQLGKSRLLPVPPAELLHSTPRPLHTKNTSARGLFSPSPSPLSPQPGAVDFLHADTQPRQGSSTPGSPTRLSQASHTSPPNVLAASSNQLNQHPGSSPHFVSSAFRRRGSFTSSSVNSSPAPPSRPSQPRRAASDPPSSPPRPQIDNIESRADFAAPDDDDNPRRSLRTRTAIQLQPFTREALMYKATLMRAGAKEALVKNPKGMTGPSDESQAPNAGVEEDSQDKEWAESQALLDDDESGSRMRRSLSPKGKGKEKERLPVWARLRSSDGDSPPRRPGPMRRHASPPRRPGPMRPPDSPPRRPGPARTHAQKTNSATRPRQSSPGPSRRHFMDSLLGTGSNDGDEDRSTSLLSQSVLETGIHKRAHKTIVTYSSKAAEKSKHRSPPRAQISSSSTPPPIDGLINPVETSSSSPTTAAFGIRSSLPLRAHSSINNDASSSPPPFPDFESRPRPSATRHSPSARVLDVIDEPARMVADQDSEEEEEEEEREVAPRLTGRFRIPESFSDNEDKSQTGNRNQREDSSVQSVARESSPATTESEEEAEDLTEHQAKVDRQRKKALVKVLPAFMIKKLEAQASRRERGGDESSDEESHNSPGEDQHSRSPEPPSDEEHGQGRVRRVYNPGGRLDIQGDSESSDSDRRRSNSRRDIPRRPSQEDDRMSVDEIVDLRHDLEDRIASSEAEEDEEDDVDIGSWLERPSLESSGSRPQPSSQAPRETRDRRPSPPPRDGDLIDRMLSRHVCISAGRKKLSASSRNRHPSSGKPRKRAPKGQTTLHQYADSGAVRNGGSGVQRRRHHQSGRSGATGSGGASRSKDKIVLDLTGGGPTLQQRKLTHGSSSHRRGAREEAVKITWREGTGAKRTIADQQAAIVISDDDEGEPPSSPPMNDLLAVLQPEAPAAENPQPTAQRPTGGSRQVENRPPERNPARPRSRKRKGALNVTSYSSALSRKSGRDSLIDFGLPCPTVGSSFGPLTYLGSGRLVRLIAILKSSIVPPHPEPLGPLNHGMTVVELEDRLPALFDLIFEWGNKSRSEESIVGHRDAVEVMRFLNDYVSWIPQVENSQDVPRVLMLVSEQVQHLMERLERRLSDEMHETDQRTLRVLWFAVENSLRVWRAKRAMQSADEEHVLPEHLSDALAPTTMAHRYLRKLITCLIEASNIKFSIETGEGLQSRNLRGATAEVWICCLHLVETSEEAHQPFGHPLWARVAGALMSGNEDGATAAGLETSEKIWKTIFTVIITSTFSPEGVLGSNPRVPHCWPLVVQALAAIRLEADKEKEARAAAEVLQKRDAYIRLVLARCLTVVTRWGWNLCGADALFRPLIGIFRSRKFENLRGETSDFPVFLRSPDEQAWLAEYDRRETSFGVFLKLVLHAVRDYEQDSRGPSFAQKQIRKMASLIFPIGATPFSRDNPPVGREISMLFNRFAAAVIVIHLEPSTAKNRVQQARRYLDFAQAESDSRSACIRGLMLVGVAHRRRRLDMGEVMVWYGDMATSLLADLARAEKSKDDPTGTGNGRLKSEISILILQLVGALRRVIETNPTNAVSSYPDPIFLEQASLDKILQSSLSTDVRTNVEIRKLLQAFLDARTSALGPRYVPENAAPLPSSDTQESDDYGMFSLDLNDPRVLAALGEVEKTPEMEMEERVAKTVKTTLSPAIFRFIQRHFGDIAQHHGRESTPLQGETLSNVDRWIQCWVSCIDVLVRNNLKGWAQYQEWGDESLDRITNQASRRLIECRFLLAVVKIDPTAYSSNKDWFVRVLLTSLVPIRFAHEHEFASALLNIDGLKHPLLEKLPCVAEDDGRYALTIRDLEELRLAMLRASSRNLVGVMRRTPQSSGDLQIITAGVTAIIAVLAAMKDNSEIAMAPPKDEAYLAFCREFVDHLRSSTLLWAKVANAASWIEEISEDS